MARLFTGLSDNQRTWVGIVVTGVIAINVYVGTLSGADAPPRWVIVLLGGIAILANVFKDQLGIRDATTARKAKETDSTLKQYRQTPSQE
jgi:hypothetical protein